MRKSENNNNMRILPKVHQLTMTKLAVNFKNDQLKHVGGGGVAHINRVVSILFDSILAQKIIK